MFQDQCRKVQKQSQVKFSVNGIKNPQYLYFIWDKSFSTQRSNFQRMKTAAHFCFFIIDLSVGYFIMNYSCVLD